MKAYDIRCPKCNAINRNLYLDETEGSYICERCKSTNRVPGFESGIRVPIYTGRALAKAFAHK